MFELSGSRQVVGPCLGAAGESVVPLQSGHARQRALAVVGFEEPGIQIAKACLHARQQQRRRQQDAGFAGLFRDSSHGISPSFGKCLRRRVLRSGEKLSLKQH